MIRIATMKYTVTRGHHKREIDRWTGRPVKIWVVRETIRKNRGVAHLFIHDNETRWKSPCGQVKHDHLTGSFNDAEKVISARDVQPMLDAFLNVQGLPFFFMKRCGKCVEWVRKNRDALIAGERMGEKQ